MTVSQASSLPQPAGLAPHEPADGAGHARRQLEAAFSLHSTGHSAIEDFGGGGTTALLAPQGMDGGHGGFVPPLPPMTGTMAPGTAMPGGTPGAEMLGGGTHGALPGMGPGQEAHGGETHGFTLQRPGLLEQAQGGSSFQQHATGGIGYAAQDFGAQGFQQRSMSGPGFSAQDFTAGSTEHQAMQGPGFSTDAFSFHGQQGGGVQQPGMSGYAMSGQDGIGQTVQGPNFQAFAFDGDAFAQQATQGPLLQGSSFSQGQTQTRLLQTGDGASQTTQGQYVQGQAFKGPFFEGQAVQGGSFSSTTLDGPNGHLETFDTQSFEAHSFTPTGRGTPPMPQFMNQFPATQPPVQAPPTPAPTPTLTESGNTVSDGRYQFKPNDLGANTLTIYDPETKSTLTAFGDTHVRDGQGDSGSFQTSSARLTLPNGTQVLMNNTPVDAKGVATLANVQITAGGKTDTLSNFGGQATLATNTGPAAASGPVLEMGTATDLNNIQVATSNGPQKALAPDMGDAQLDSLAPAQAQPQGQVG